MQLGYQVDLGKQHELRGLTTPIAARATSSRTTTSSLYALRRRTATTLYPGPIDHPDSLFLGPRLLRLRPPNPGSNFVIATLAGGKRDYQGVEFIFRKRFSDNWQALVSYTFIDAEGNTNSDSNADFQGDVLFLDPRAPNQFGRQPGMIAHLFKARRLLHVQLRPAARRVLRGTPAPTRQRTFRASGRNLPIAGPIRSSSPASRPSTGSRRTPSAASKNPSWGLLDLRAQYICASRRRANEFFLDLFNVPEQPEATRDQDLVAGQGGVAFGNGLSSIRRAVRISARACAFRAG